ncbi:MAG: TonB-dependent receptor [Steroidobacteraceae bacterium]
MSIAAGAAAAPGEPGNVIEEIIVTAQKRAENIQSVPVAITALSANDLEKNGIANWVSIQSMVPTLVLDPGYGSMTTPKMFIRGVGVDNNVFSFDTPIGLYVDGVYFARVIGGLVDLFDVDRVEVLRGPQGTLYGRNSSIGAVSLHTQLPPLDAVDFKAAAGVGSKQQRDAQFSVGVPIIDGVLGARFSFGTRNNDGYQREAATGRSAMGDDVKTYRASLLYKPNDQFDLTVRGDYMVDNSPDAVGWRFRNADGSLNLKGDPFVFNEGPNTPVVQHTDPWGLSATLAWHAAAFDVTSISAYRHLRFRDAADVDGKSTVNSFEVWRQDLDQNQLTQEVYVSSRSSAPDAIRWVAGAFYLHEKNDFAWALAIFAPPPTTYYHQDTKSTAGYAQVTWPVTPKLSLTGGVRYTSETKDLTAHQVDADGIVVPDFNFAGSLSAHKFNYRASVEYKLGDNMLAYLSDATGFRSGGFNGSSTDLDGIVSGQFGPEDTNTAELGFKGEFLENRLRLNVDYFLAKYKHLQQAITDPNNGAISTTNADAKVHGLEAEASAVLTDRWQASLTLSNTHQKIDGTSAVLKQNPEWMWRVGTFYSVPAQPIHGQLRLGAYANYSGSYFQDSGNDPLLRTHAYYVWGASIGYEHEGKHWSALLQGLNLGDQVYPVGGFNIFNGVISSVWYPSFPRRWHLGVQYRF